MSEELEFKEVAVKDDAKKENEKAKSLKKNSQSKVFYRRLDYDGHLMSNLTEIKDYKVYQRRDVILNSLLGDFDANGDYKLKQSVIDSVVKLRKVIVNNYRDIVFVKSQCKFRNKGYLEFSIIVSKMDNGKKKGVLTLLESIKKMNGAVENTNSFVVAEFIGEDDDNFTSNMKKAFNVIEEKDTAEKDDESVLGAIILRLSQCEKLKNSYFSLENKKKEEEYLQELLEYARVNGKKGIISEFDRLKEKYDSLISSDEKLQSFYLTELFNMAVFNEDMKQEEPLLLTDAIYNSIVEKRADYDNSYVLKLDNFIDNVIDTAVKIVREPIKFVENVTEAVIEAPLKVAEAVVEAPLKVAEAVTDTISEVVGNQEPEPQKVNSRPRRTKNLEEEMTR